MVISVVRALGPILVHGRGLAHVGRDHRGVSGRCARATRSTLGAFGSDPVKRLVVPRVAALLIALPVLTIIGDALAVIGVVSWDCSTICPWSRTIRGCSDT